MVGLAHGQAAEPQNVSGQLMSWPYRLGDLNLNFDTASLNQSE